MELGLSLGDASKSIGFLKTPISSQKPQQPTNGLDFCMALSLQPRNKELGKTQKSQENGDKNVDDGGGDRTSSDGDVSDNNNNNSQGENPLQLSLLPLPLRISSHLQSMPRPSGNSENGSSGNIGLPVARIYDVSRIPAAADSVSSVNTGNGNLTGVNKRDFWATRNDVVDAERASSRTSDDDENGLNTRKKLRLSKEQSAFLEESFKEHSTLNPKQKLAIAKQLNLRPRQVEVWFQNRRARTKLKQTEVDCEYLKRCCETLTEENRRLHKELQELRALKNSDPYYMQLPATTLTMCPSCERVATAPPPTSTATATQNFAVNSTPTAIPFFLARPQFYPFSSTAPTRHRNQPATS